MKDPVRGVRMPRLVAFICLFAIFCSASAKSDDEPLVEPGVEARLGNSSAEDTKPVMSYIFEEGDDSRLIPISEGSGTNFKKVQEKKYPDGTVQSIYFRRVKVKGGGEEEKIDWKDDDPLSTVRAVKETITPSGETFYKEFEGPSWREKILVTIPKADGSDVTIFSKKFRVGRNGQEYEVDWDEEGEDIIVKNLQRTIKPDGTVMITDVIEPKSSALAKSEPLRNVRYILRRADGSIVDLGFHNEPTVASVLGQGAKPAQLKQIGNEFCADASYMYVYEGKVKEMEDGSEFLKGPTPAGARTKLFSKVLRLDGRIAVTEVKLEMPKETTLLRIEKIIKKRPDGTLVELDPDISDSEPNAEFVTRIFRTKKLSSKNQEIHIEDDLLQFTRKIYTHTNKGIIATDYRGGLVLRKYKSQSGLSFAVHPNSRNANFKIPSKGYFDRGVDFDGDDFLGNNEGAKNRTADQLLYEGQRANITIADLPEAFLKTLSQLFGAGFIVRPKYFVGGYISSAGVGSETKKIKWADGCLYFENKLFGLDKFFANSLASLGGDLDDIPFFKGLLGLG